MLARTNDVVHDMTENASVGVSIRGLSVHYGAFRALDNVSLDIAPGEFMSLLGPSGSGKTSLLSILGGFAAPSAGSIWFGDADVTLTPPHRRGIGVVFQNYALFPHMTVGENVAFPLRARRIAKSAWRAEVRRALDLVELGGFEERSVAQLSGGQRQRVALARAIVFHPKLILMDEPLSALDKQLRESMQIELRALHGRLGATTVYVTHDQREALTMSNRIAVLKAGRLVQVDTPERLYENPQNRFVASFIGEATLVPVQRVGTDCVSIGSAVLRSTRSLPASGPLLIALQTEKLVVASPGGEAGLNLLSGVIADVIYQGESLRVFAQLEGGPVISFRQPSHHAGRGQIPQRGGAITLGLHPSDTIIVSAEDG